MPCLSCLKGNRPSHRFVPEQNARAISNLLGTSAGDMPGLVLDVTAFPLRERYTLAADTVVISDGRAGQRFISQKRAVTLPC